MKTLPWSMVQRRLDAGYNTSIAQCIVDLKNMGILDGDRYNKVLLTKDALVTIKQDVDYDGASNTLYGLECLEKNQDGN